MINNEISRRKAKHITVCTESEYQVEPREPRLFNGLRFLHNPMPELALEEINTETSFLGHKLPLPLFISCMTGGSEEGHEANKHLARGAQACGIPVGMGSIRILFDHEELFPHFHLKTLAPDVPVLANIGIAQIKEIAHDKIVELVKRLEVQALVIHLNPGQEIFQPAGDTDFRGLKESLAQFCEKAPFPCIVKETGFGIPPAIIAFLKKIGIDYIDLAGSGGTNWVSVESYRLPKEDFSTAREFEHWGYPTPFLLELLKGTDNILASGGLRDGSDLAKSIALGAKLGGMALPFIRAVIKEGAEGVSRITEQIRRSLKAVMLLTGSGNLEALSQQVLWRSPDYESQLSALKRAIEEKASS